MNSETRRKSTFLPQLESQFCRQIFVACEEKAICLCRHMGSILSS